MEITSSIALGKFDFSIIGAPHGRGKVLKMPEKRHTARLIFAAFYGFWLCFGNTMRIFCDLASFQNTSRSGLNARKIGPCSLSKSS